MCLDDLECLKGLQLSAGGHRGARARGRDTRRAALSHASSASPASATCSARSRPRSFYRLGPKDVVVTVATDAFDRYPSVLRKLTARVRQDDARANGPDAWSASSTAPSPTGSRTAPGRCRQRWHNQKYFTWVEQQGKTVEQLREQATPDFWLNEQQQASRRCDQKSAVNCAGSPRRDRGESAARPPGGASNRPRAAKFPPNLRARALRSSLRTPNPELPCLLAAASSPPSCCSPRPPPSPGRRTTTRRLPRTRRRRPSTWPAPWPGWSPPRGRMGAGAREGVAAGRGHDRHLHRRAVPVREHARLGRALRRRPAGHRLHRPRHRRRPRGDAGNPGRGHAAAGEAGAATSTRTSRRRCSARWCATLQARRTAPDGSNALESSVLRKVQAAQRKDGSFSADGWAPMLSRAFALGRALRREGGRAPRRDEDAILAGRRGTWMGQYDAREEALRAGDSAGVRAVLGDGSWARRPSGAGS